MPNQFTAPLWGDEGFSAILSMHTLPNIIKIIINDTSPPLWNIFEWAVFNIFGTSEIFIRGLAFSFYLLTIFFVFKLSKFFWDRQTAIFASLLTALNPFFFIYAFEGRMYSIMSAGVAGSFYFFARLIFTKEKWQKKHLLGYIFFTLWALYSHHFAILAVGVQGLWFLYLLFKDRKKVFPIFLGLVGVAFGYLPWVYPLYNQVKMVGGGFWLGRPKLIDLGALILEYLAFGIKHSLAFPALVFILTALGIRKWRVDFKKSLFILSWFLVPIIAAFMISQVFSSVFYNRYLLYTIPAAMILVASQRRRFSNVVIAIVLFLFVIIDIFYFTNPTKLRFDQLSSYVKNTKQSGDILINWNGSAHHLWETKYYGIPSPIYIPGSTDLPYFVGTALMENDDILRQIPKNTKRIGVVTSGDIEEIKLPGYTIYTSVMFDRLKFVWFIPTK